MVSLAVKVNVVEPTDEALFAAYRQAGDRNAFDQLVKRYEREMYGFLRKKLGGDRCLAEDVFQHTFFNAARYAHSFAEGRAFRPWLYQIARNLTSDAWQSQSRERTYLDTRRRNCDNSRRNGVCVNTSTKVWEDDPADRVVEDETKQLQSEQVRQALASLPEAARRVISLVYFQGMNYREAAKVLGCDSRVLKYRMFRAIKKLNAMLEQDNIAEHEVCLKAA